MRPFAPVAAARRQLKVAPVCQALAPSQAKYVSALHAQALAGNELGRALALVTILNRVGAHARGLQHILLVVEYRATNTPVPFAATTATCYDACDMVE